MWLNFFSVLAVSAAMVSCVTVSPSRVPVQRLARAHGLDMSPADALVTLSNDVHVLTFHENSRRLMFDGCLVLLSGAARREDGLWSIARPDADDVVDALLSKAARPVPAEVTTVVLDPGHGGEDSGARGVKNIVEKKVTLDLARRVRARLRSQGLRVRMTRTGDKTVSLSRRPALARAWEADLFVSIHLNSAPNPHAAGLETYSMPAEGFPSTAPGSLDTVAYPGNRFDGANMALAYAVHSRILHRTRCADRGIRRARFEVIRQAPCPAVLVECAFVSNTRDAERLLDATYRDAIAEGIAQGILEYIGKPGTTAR